MHAMKFGYANMDKFSFGFYCFRGMKLTDDVLLTFTASCTKYKYIFKFCMNII